MKYFFVRNEGTLFRSFAGAFATMLKENGCPNVVLVRGAFTGSDKRELSSKSGVTIPVQRYREFFWGPRVDIAHLQYEMVGNPIDVMLGPITVLLSRVTARRIVVTLHHVLSHTEINDDFLHFYSRHIPSIMVKLALKVCYFLFRMTGCLICVAYEKHKNMLVQEYGFKPECISILPNPSEDMRHSGESSNTARKKMKLPVDAETIFGYIGYMNRSRGILEMVQAFCIHVRKHPKDLMLVGGNISLQMKGAPDVMKYREDIVHTAKTGGQERILFLGNLDENQVCDFYGAVDYIMLPYRHFKGSWSLPRAMASERLVIASNAFTGLVPAAVRSEVIPSEIATLMDKASLGTLYADPALQRWVHEERERSSTGSVAHVALGLYTKLLAS